MADQPDGEDRVSREAHQRVVTERDQLKAQVDELSTTVKDLGMTRKMEELLAGKVADPRTAAEMLLPHIRDVNPDELETHISSDRFAPRLQAFAPPAQTPPPSDGGDGDTEPSAPADPGSGFAGPGPNPGSGGQPPAADKKISRGSPEFKAAVERGDHALVQEWFDKGLVEEPVKAY